jgi:hypothetical protein
MNVCVIARLACASAPRRDNQAKLAPSKGQAGAKSLPRNVAYLSSSAVGNALLLYISKIPPLHKSQNIATIDG